MTKVWFEGHCILCVLLLSWHESMHNADVMQQNELLNYESLFTSKVTYMQKYKQQQPNYSSTGLN